MKVAIIIIVYNLPSEVTILQVNAIRKFCKDEHEIFIVDNSTDKDMSEATRYHCGQLGVEYMKTNASSKNGSDSHAFSANFSYQRFISIDQIIAFVDHDVVPIKSFSFSEILGDKIIAGLGQGGNRPYYWPGLVFWNNDKIDKGLVDFSPMPGMDTGAGLSKIIDRYGVDNCIFLNESYHENPYFKDPKFGSYSEINDNMFLHFTGSSNWRNEPRHLERINSLINVATEKINAN